MTVTGNSGGGEFHQIPVGSYLARCYQIIDIGTQPDKFNDPPKPKHQCILGFEMPNDLIESEDDYNGKPYTMSKFYTWSLHPKARLNIDLSNWRNKKFTDKDLDGFELTNVLGKWCQIQVGLTENDKFKITAIIALMKGQALPKGVNPTVVFDLDNYLAGDRSVYDTLSEGLKKLINQSVEVQQSLIDNGELPQSVEDNGTDSQDDVPF
jgi:hypothetical protein